MIDPKLEKTINVCLLVNLYETIYAYFDFKWA